LSFLIDVHKKQPHCHMYGGIKTLRHNLGTTLRLAYHGCKNLTHTSKTRHVTIHVFVTFSDCKEWNATKPSREMMWGSNQDRRQKVLNRGVLHLRRGTSHSENLIKYPLICGVLYFNLIVW